MSADPQETGIFSDRLSSQRKDLKLSAGGKASSGIIDSSRSCFPSGRSK